MTVCARAAPGATPATSASSAHTHEDKAADPMAPLARAAPDRRARQDHTTRPRENGSIINSIRTPPAYGHPPAYFVRKHEKSATFSVGAAVEPSQFAYGSPAA